VNIGPVELLIVGVGVMIFYSVYARRKGNTADRRLNLLLGWGSLECVYLLILMQEIRLK
jgi:hypothetical protein